MLVHSVHAVEAQLASATQRSDATEERLRAEVNKAESLLNMAQDDVAELRLLRSDLEQVLVGGQIDTCHCRILYACILPTLVRVLVRYRVAILMDGATWPLWLVRAQQLDDTRKSSSNHATAERAKLQGELAQAGKRAAAATQKLEGYVAAQVSLSLSIYLSLSLSLSLSLYLSACGEMFGGVELAFDQIESPCD